MNFEKVASELKGLQEQVESNKVDTRFEKNKLKDYLGKSLYRTLSKHNAIIAGGMITSLFTGSEINDVDVYFRSKEDLAAFIEDVYDNYIMSHTKKATMFVENVDGREVKVQAIHFKYFESPEDVFNTFDFTSVMGAYDFKTEDFVLHRDFLKHNAQRILKFNKDTAFPLISIIRTNKYIDRDYTISKPELMRIIMACMNLEINSYEELKDHLGGMYGENLDKMFEDVEDEEFSLDKAIDKLQDLSLSDEYFVKPEPVKFNNLDELVHSACGIVPKWFEHNGEEYRVQYDGTVERLYENLPENAEKVDAKDFLDVGKVYKFVKKDDEGNYRSFWDNSFKYVIGEEIETSNDHGLYFNTFDTISNSTYSNEEDKVLIEARVDFDDLIECVNHMRYSKVKVLREVPEEEWSHLV